MFGSKKHPQTETRNDWSLVFARPRVLQRSSREDLEEANLFPVFFSTFQAVQDTRTPSAYKDPIKKVA